MPFAAILIIILTWCSLAAAGVVNVEFSFTPFIGDPVKNDKVETVAGKASVFINNVLFAQEDVGQQMAPVLFQEREIGPSVWVPTYQLGPRLRKGKNVFRIEFDPAQGKASYNAYLAWASVTDTVTKREESGRYQETNQTDKGSETRPSVGKVVLERGFVADFATDLPWHHYKPVTSLTNEDKQRVIALINERAKAFKPDFLKVYHFLEGKEGLKVEEVRKAGCLEKAHSVGIRIGVPGADQFDFIITGNPEVVIQRKGGDLFSLKNQNLLKRVGNDDMQMCAAMALYVAYPPRLAVVRGPSGVWEVAY